MLEFLKKNIFIIVLSTITLIVGFLTFLTFIDRGFIELNEKNLQYLLISNIFLLFLLFIFISKLEKFKGAAEEERDENGNIKKNDYYNPWNARLVHAYPYTVASIPYSAGAAQLVKVTVGFYYEYSHLMHSM